MGAALLMLESKDETSYCNPAGPQGIMQAVILAGGRGKRLRPITDYVPKPLVPIGNMPIVEWQIKYLKSFGIRDVILCTGYRSDLLEDFMRAKKNMGIRVTISTEKTPAGNGRGAQKGLRVDQGRGVFCNERGRDHRYRH